LGHGIHKGGGGTRKGVGGGGHREDCHKVKPLFLNKYGAKKN